MRPMSLHLVPKLYLGTSLFEKLRFVFLTIRSLHRPQSVFICAICGRSLPQSFRNNGNNITSRIDAVPVANIANRSIPMPKPAVGGMPTSSAVM